MKTKIFVRSYGRSEMVQEQTLKFLMAQKDLNLQEQLHLIVHEDELETYQKALKDFPVAKFITKTEKGGHNSIKAMHEFLEPDEPFLLLDDDLGKCPHYVGSVSKETKQDLDCLGAYIEYAEEQLKKCGGRFWSIKPLQNMNWVAQKPFAEHRPGFVLGFWFGGFNHPSILTEFAHNDDVIRSARITEKFGGVLLFNWVCLDTFVIETHPGGMQGSGDRGAAEERKAHTKRISDACYEIPVVKKFCEPPDYEESRGMWRVKLKSMTKVKKLINVKKVTWKTYFQEDADNVNDPIQNMFGGSL